MARIAVIEFGEVPQLVVDKILSAMGECYEAIGEPVGDSIIDVCIYEESEEETFFATYDALRGKPRIAVYLDKFLELPEVVILAGIRRQAAHSVLHGSLEYYLIAFPQALVRAMRQYNLPQGYANTVLYGTAMTAKEYEVTQVLYEKNFVEDQVAYAKYILEPSNGEALAWEIALRNRLEKILYLSAIIRDISCAVPLTRDERFGAEIEEYVEKKIACITPAYKSRIRRIIDERFSLLGTDTLENIGLTTQFLVEEIIDPELGD